jgi:hypothetical protein
MDGIFIHIPKNAGSSIQETLPKNCLVHKHAGVDKIIEDFGKDFFSKRFSFAIVRNPWCRMVSLYCFKRSQWMARIKSEPHLLKRPIAKYYLNDDFRGFVRWWINLSFKRGCHYHAGNSQQIDWLIDGNGEIVVDFVGRFERLRQDHQKIMSRLHVDNRPVRINRIRNLRTHFQRRNFRPKFKTLPHINRTRHKKYPHYYDGPTRKLVGNAYRKDIEIFRYRFGK